MVASGVAKNATDVATTATGVATTAMADGFWVDKKLMGCRFSSGTAH